MEDFEGGGMTIVTNFLNNSNISTGQLNDSSVSISRRLDHSADPDFGAIDYKSSLWDGEYLRLTNESTWVQESYPLRGPKADGALS
jgi:hypothetical protein